jgi:flagellar hook-basal body complex protein FliE
MNQVEISSLLSQMRAMKGEAQGVKPQPPATGPGGVDFATMLKQTVDGVNAQQKGARAMQEEFLSGSNKYGLEEVMVAVEKASLSFEAMSQVRKKLVSAYQEVMRMQV